MSGITMKSVLILSGMMLTGVAIGSLALYTVLGKQQGNSAWNNITNKQTATIVDKKQNKTEPVIPAAQEPDSSLTEQEKAELALNELDETAAHPLDPQTPAGIRGKTDDELGQMPRQQIANLIARTLPYAESDAGQPRHMFALGRAALIHGDKEFAKELLEKASNKGSLAADAYLAHLSDDLDEQAAYLKRSLKGGFTPAKSWLNKVEAAIAREKVQVAVVTPPSPKIRFDANKYNRPDLIGSFYSSNTSHLNADLLSNLTYASTIHGFLSDHSKVLFLAENRMIVTEVDPNLSYVISSKIMTSRRGMNQAVNAGLQSFLGPLIAIAQTRKQGGSIGDEVMASNKAIMQSPLVKLDVIKQQATQDAQRLVILYDSNPEAFRKVYRGLKKFVTEIN